jgi:Cu-Zn family superoxide dismutase
MRWFVCALLAGVFAAAPAVGDAAEMALATLLSPENEPVGQASIEQTPRGLLIHVTVSGLAPGAHGIHLHAVGACTPDFKAAGGHIKMPGQQHGLLDPQGPEAGDLPNLYVGADGRGEAEFFTALLTISELLDADGSAVVIHADADDHMTQPIGGSGDRIVCGVIKGS